MADDDPTFDEFFRRQHDPLLRLCFALTLDREAARDVAQETMARAWSDWPRLRQGSPVAWSRQVALNLVRSRGRRRRTAQEAVMDRVPDVELAVADLDLLDALRGLSTRQREAVVLHHLVDLPVADVASSMGIGVPAVKTHLQRGRARLEELLATEAQRLVPDQQAVPEQQAVADERTERERQDTEVPS